MGYKETIRLLKSDYSRYAPLSSGGGIKQFISVCVHERGFLYTVFLRLTSVKSLFKPLFWMIYHHLSSKYGIQISTHTKIGPGLYIGHGVGIVINQSAIIGSNVSLSQFLTIGSTRGKAAIIEDNVYIGPGVCLVEDVTIGHHSKIGAGAVVTKSIPAYSVAVGVPAKVIKELSNEKI